MAVLDKLEREEGLTDIEAELARFICANADEVCHMGIADLSKASFTSSATVVRLCQKVGVRGFRDLRVELASDLALKRANQSEVDVNKPFADGQPVADVVSSVVTLTKEAVDICHASLDVYDIERVARAIRAAGHVYLFGHGDSEINAIAFANLLLKLGVPCIIANQFGEAPSVSHCVRKNDVVIIVSYKGGILKEMEMVLPVFKERGCKTVLISSIAPPLGIDYCLRFPAKEAGKGNVATYYSQTCIRLILNCIYGEIFELDYEASRRSKEQAERFNH